MGRFSLLELVNAGRSCVGNRDWGWLTIQVFGREVPMAVGETVVPF